MATKKIKLLKPWGLLSKGHIFSPNTPIADLLIQQKRAEEVTDAPVEVKPKLFIRKQAWVK